MDLKIHSKKTNKHNIKTNSSMDENIIAAHPCSIIFSGKSGSGKSNLISNLMTREVFYKNYYEIIHLFSSSPDDLFHELKVPDENIHTDSKTWDTELEKIYKSQTEAIKKNGIDKAKRVLIIFEDVINNGVWLRRSPWFVKSFVANRQFGISVFLTTQSWTRIPRVSRLNASVVYFFKGSQSETKIIAEEYAPSSLSQNEFISLLSHAVKEPYCFLTINNRLPENIKFRKNLDIILEIDG